MSRITDWILDQEDKNNLTHEGDVYKPTPEYIKFRKGTEPLIDTLVKQQEREADEQFIREREAWIVEQFELSCMEN